MDTMFLLKLLQDYQVSIKFGEKNTMRIRPYLKYSKTSQSATIEHEQIRYTTLNIFVI